MLWGLMRYHDERHTAAFRTIFKLVSAAADIDRPAPLLREPTAQDIDRQQQLEQERIRIRHHPAIVTTRQ